MNSPSPTSQNEKEWTQSDTQACNVVITITTIYWMMDFVAAKLIHHNSWMLFVTVGIYMFYLTMFHSIAKGVEKHIGVKNVYLSAINNVMFIAQGFLFISASKVFPEPMESLYWGIGVITLVIAVLVFLVDVDKD